MSSGASTPLSASSTVLSSPSLSPKVAFQDIYANPRVSASTAVEFLASRADTSSAVYVYDLAEQVGFGTLTKEWAKSQNAASVVDLQTRAGAGLSLVGRLSEGTSRDAGKASVITAYTTPAGLAQMAPALSYLPPATASSRLVIQVPTVTSVGETFSLSPSLASLAAVVPTLHQDLVLFLSATPQETADFTHISYRLATSHVVHLFDHYSVSREIGTSLVPPQSNISASSVADVFAQAGYSFFNYAGDSLAHTALVLLNGPLALIAKTLVRQIPGLGVVIVNVLRPWDEQALRDALPQSVHAVHVLDDVPNASTQGSLYVDVFGTLLEAKTTFAVHAHRIVPTQTHTYLSRRGAFFEFLATLVPSTPKSPRESLAIKKLVVFGTPQSTLASAPHFIADTFLSSEALSTRFLADYDVFSRKGGIVASRLLLGSKGALAEGIPIPFTISLDHETTGEADFLAILDHALLTSHSLLKHAKVGSVVLLASAWSVAEVSSNLPADVTALLSARNIRLFVVDPKAVASNLVGGAGAINDAIQNLVVHLAFLRLYMGKAAQQPLILKIARGLFDEVIHGVELSEINAQVWSALVEVPVDSPSSTDVAAHPLKDFELNAIAVQTDEGDVVNGARLGSWHDAAKHLLFPAAFNLSDETDTYAQNPALHPEVPDRTFLVTCTVNRRLTAKEYDRNVFHLEFDTNGTGLKYAIGEALGVHGWNDEQDVHDFCRWYGVDPNRLVTIPVPGSEDKMHTRTVFQALQQQIDLFGQPPKSFYTDLAPHATTSVDKHALLFIGAPEGVATFKKMSEKDTVTFADVLRMYPSARPGIETLCEMVGDIKPRHYSIASAQSVVGNRVDLLVVTVEWVTPCGSPRYGQCTRYLAGLKVGQKVTVSIKPSVMKLPPDNRQPLIMAGLGTGAAPFRAFLQHRAMLVQRGEEVGPVYYYFGSRYQSQEYLYGEEIEAFILDGVITRAGLAFSRDGPRKVYIQHKMLEDSEVLARMLQDDRGVFYLCGPTWPVPDVYEALVGALVKYKGQTTETAGEYLESLKEEERYVLEVY
ncbi:Assimilatory sulfite reductase [Mycena venus]|uniref:assimilatory sulfite reductase (NADPH) n=1 Tax=Mycena venus TaxID=2733690 RepID=A0A8H6Y5S0_9AGAR|nr:Assimilatory sulfite reductase [Mycena venus]